MIHLSDDQKIKNQTVPRGDRTFAVFKIKGQIFPRICEAADSDLTVQRRISSGTIPKRR